MYIKWIGAHVETVDTRDQSTSCFNGANTILCRDSRYTKIKAYWAMHCVLCLMSRLSIQEIKALDTSMVQMLCYVHMFLPITFLIFNGFSIRKKVLECWEPGLFNHTTKSYMSIVSIVSTVSTLPVHYCIEILRLVSTVSTYIGFDGMVEKPWFSAFQNFFRIENPLNIKKVMGRNMCTCICILYRLYRHNIAFEPLKYLVLWSLVSTVSTWDTTHNALLSMLWS